MTFSRNQIQKNSFIRSSSYNRVKEREMYRDVDELRE